MLPCRPLSWVVLPAALTLAAACAHAPASTASAAARRAAPAPGSDAAPPAPPLAEAIDAPQSLRVTSGEFTDGGPLAAAHAFRGMGCTGHNAPPELSWQGAPPATKSFALIVHDPDAPTGVGFFHWVAFDIPADVTRVGGDAGALPAAARAGLSDYGAPGYGGPCPPPGPAHRYVTTVYALDVAALPVEGAVTGAKLRFLLRGHTLAFGRLTGTFQRL